MAKPNYAFAKRQRDLAKKQKKEEKKLRKNVTPGDGSSENAAEQTGTEGAEGVEGVEEVKGGQGAESRKGLEPGQGQALALGGARGDSQQTGPDAGQTLPIPPANR